jgi:hypothetical protein
MTGWAIEAINWKYYLEVLDLLRQRMMIRIRMEIADDWNVHQDDAPAHTHSVVSSWISGEKVHSTISTGSSFLRSVTLWFLLFPNLKWTVEVYHFQTLDRVQKAVTDAIETLKEAGFHILLWGVENSLGQVCCIKVMIFWRRQCWFRRIIE